MGTRKTDKAEQYERAIERALVPGSFISEEDAWSFNDKVEAVAEKVEKLVERDPQLAVRVYETFIAACHEKAEEVDDSSGDFGMFVARLFCGWIKACTAAGVDRDDMVKSLLVWMEDDPYGFCWDLDREAVTVLDKEGLDAFIRQVREKLDTATKKATSKETGTTDYSIRRWTVVLKRLLAAQRNVDAYIALCEETAMEAEDCKTIAEMYREGNRPDEALAWVERGRGISRSERLNSLTAHDLAEMERALLCELGRGSDALASASSRFQELPSLFNYDQLMRYVPAKQKKKWHEKAMKSLGKGRLTDQIEVWLETQEIERLAARLRKATDEELESLSHLLSDRLAPSLELSHPAVAARVYRGAAMRIVNAGKSKYYPEALANLENAKKCYEKAGSLADWETLVAEVRERHHRKRGFITGFEPIVTGTRLVTEPSFLTRAKTRWPR